MKTITISRQYGSGGRRIAALLSEKLGISFYDSNLLLIAGERYGLNPALLHEFDERKNSSFLYGLGMLADGYTNEDRVMLPYKLFQAQKDSIERLVKEGPCIFVGRCADQILKDRKDVLRVFVYASNMEDRVNRIKALDNISYREALDRIAEKDRQRKDYYYFHTGQEWGRKENYDLCLNTSTMGYETCINILAELALAKKPY